MLKAEDRIALQETRTKVAFDPRLESNLEFVDFNEPGNRVVELFEAGKVAVFDNVPAIASLDTIRRAPVRPDLSKYRPIKKAKLPELLTQLTKDSFARHPLSLLFPDNLAEARSYRDEVGIATTFMTKTAKRLFPGYTFTGEVSHSWRLTETFVEELHVDSYGSQNDESVRVRLFLNCDDIPRIWGTSYDAPTLVDRYWDECHLEDVADQHPNLINAALASRVPWATLPAHKVFFAPGAMWCGCSQTVSHEIIYGRRMWAYTFSVDPKSMRNPEARFTQKVRAVVARKRT